jgi:hypothetical protein
MRIEGLSPLIIRINVKLSRIDKELDRIERNRKAYRANSRANELSDLVTSGTAFAIHNVYNGIEQILEDIARDLDGGLPNSSNWHSDLLDQLSSETPLRPSVIPEEILEPVRDLMRFRHFFRHSYGVEFREPEIDEKYASLKDVIIPTLVSSLKDLSAHLDKPADPEKSGSGIDDGPP